MEMREKIGRDRSIRKMTHTFSKDSIKDSKGSIRDTTKDSTLLLIQGIRGLKKNRTDNRFIKDTEDRMDQSQLSGSHL